MVSVKAFVAVSWAGLSAAHLIMKSPVPFGVDTLNSSPLNNAAIGSASSDFPCKQRTGVYKVSQMNNMPVGQAQTLSFTGSASHGGGTCQLAVSLDHEPTVSSTWKIIQVYEGGCPTSGSGNGGTDVFSFKIPDKFPNGQATLAWTWFNKVGNREIYMNCAPITVSGGTDNNDYYDTLPDMYVINLPTSDCSSVESSNQIIPNPGQFVLKGDASAKLTEATGPKCAAAAAAQLKGVSGYQAPAGNDTAAATIATTAAAANNGLYTPPVAVTTAVQSPSIVSTTATVQTTPVASPAGSTTPQPLSLMITVPVFGSTAANAPAQSVVSYVAPSVAAPSANTAATQPTPLIAIPPPVASSLAVPAVGTGAALPPVAPPKVPLPPVIANGTTIYPAASTVAATSIQTTLLTTTKPAASVLASLSPSNPLLSTVDSATQAIPSQPASSPTSGIISGNTDSRPTCPTDGVLLCNGPSQFGLCDHGHVVWQTVATGTTCSNGAITKRHVVLKSDRKEQLGRWFIEG